MNSKKENSKKNDQFQLEDLLADWLSEQAESTFTVFQVAPPTHRRRKNDQRCRANPPEAKAPQQTGADLSQPLKLPSVVWGST